MIDGSEKRKRQLALELLQRSLVFEKCSNKLKICMIMSYNIARVLALYKSSCAAMNKIFIYARPCVNKMT